MKALRWALLAVLVSMCCVGPVQADHGPYTVFLPAVGGGESMSYWQVVKPVATTNLIDNPQFYNNITDGWTQAQSGAGGAWARDTTKSWIGPASLKITAGDDNTRVSSAAISLADGETIYARCRAWESTAGHADMQIYDTTTPAGRGTDTGADTDSWEQLEKSWTNSTGGAVNVVVQLRNMADDSSSDVYFDAIQAEIDTGDYTTYIDGDQPDGYWQGEAHNSPSERGALARTGGVAYDLLDDYHLRINRVIGAGGAPVRIDAMPFGTRDGGIVLSQGRGMAPLSLQGTLEAGTHKLLHEYRKDLKQLVDRTTYAIDMPVRIHYTGADTEKYTYAIYEAGLEGDMASRDVNIERLNLRFLQEDPNWYNVGDSAQAITAWESFTSRYMMTRLRADKQWSAMGLTNVPDSGSATYAMCRASDGYLYVGGAWEGLDSVAGRDYAARYKVADGTWETLVGASDLNGTVFGIKEGPDGKIYLVGAFTEVNGDAGGDADYIIVYNSGSWEKLGIPNTGSASITDVRDLAWDSEGNLYVVGTFTTFADETNADGIAKWDGTSWSAVGDPTAGSASLTAIYGIAIDQDDTIYVFGDFETLGNVTDADMWAKYDTTNGWATVGGIALDTYALSGTFDSAGNLYVGGNFGDVNSVDNTGYFFMWNGSRVSSCGTPPFDGQVYKIAEGPDGLIYVAGSSNPPNHGIAVWNRSDWTYLDAYLLDNNGYSVALGPADPTVPGVYDIHVASQRNAITYRGYLHSITYNGTVTAYPKIVLKGSGDSEMRLHEIRNWRTGHTLRFAYTFTPVETITIDTHPERLSITSSLYGDISGAMLTPNDFGKFGLYPGDNDITVYVDYQSGGTITGFFLWQDTYDGYDD